MCVFSVVNSFVVYHSTCILGMYVLSTSGSGTCNVLVLL